MTDMLVLSIVSAILAWVIALVAAKEKHERPFYWALAFSILLGIGCVTIMMAHYYSLV